MDRQPHDREADLQVVLAALLALDPRNRDAGKMAQEIVTEGRVPAGRPYSMSMLGAAARRVMQAVDAGADISDQLRVATDTYLAGYGFRLSDPIGAVSTAYQEIGETWRHDNGRVAAALRKLGDATVRLVGQTELDPTDENRALATEAVFAYRSAAEEASAESRRPLETGDSLMLSVVTGRLFGELTARDVDAAPAVVKHFGESVVEGLADGPARAVADVVREQAEVDIRLAGRSSREPQQGSDPGALPEAVWRRPFALLLEDYGAVTGVGPGGIRTYLDAARAFGRALRVQAREREAAGSNATVALERLAGVAGRMLQQGRPRGRAATPASIRSADRPTAECRPVAPPPPPQESSPEAAAWADAYARAATASSGPRRAGAEERERWNGRRTFAVLTDVVGITEAWMSGLPAGTAPHVAEVHTRAQAALGSAGPVAAARNLSHATAGAMMAKVNAVRWDVDYVVDVQATAAALLSFRAPTIAMGDETAAWLQVEQEVAATLVPGASQGQAERHPLPAVDALALREEAHSNDLRRVARADRRVRGHYLVATAGLATGSVRAWSDVASHAEKEASMNRVVTGARAGVAGAMVLSQAALVKPWKRRTAGGRGTGPTNQPGPVRGLGYDSPGGTG